MRNSRYSLIFLTLCSFNLLIGCGDEAPVETKTAKVRPVKLLTIEEGAKQEHYTFPAVVDAVQSSKIAFQVDGLIEKLNVIAAEEVEQGEVVAQLEQRDFNNQVASAKAQFEAARDDYQRAIQLSKDGVVSASDLGQIKSQRDVAEAQLDTAKKALSDSTLKAPFTGTIVEVPVKPFENIKSGDHILTIMGKGQMEAIVNVPASIVVTVDRNNPPVSFVTLDAAPDMPIPAIFRRANLEADQASQTYEVRFVFTPLKDLNVLPGMNATLDMTFPFAELNNQASVSVPIYAILSESDAQYVWVVNSADQTVSKRQVKVQEGIGELLYVTDGLVPGEVIVGAGASYLSEGMKVRPWTKS